ncbi:PTI1-like tyrosine-protein kinase At3g15890 [Zingiber officinale]|uniref:PTI1-like tyrosine-protein kinase At3g15890 n=1 Tax=Zingiber officinale TaxID=94328 RepID=UPI001C4D2E84|nr:PTI1-like tyrosine-protein kinase At3g15890 [Zingiber officinale]
MEEGSRYREQEERRRRRMAFRSLLCCGTSRDGKEPGKKGSPAWRVFSLQELYIATNKFNYDNKLGEGGFGSVYRGRLYDGTQIAVKRLKVWSNRAEMEFAAEVEVLAKVRHKNLLNLRGYCTEGKERLIVYDYMPNLSLVSHLHGQHSQACALDWKRRMNIAIGSAEGIAYLHHHDTQHIIHRDIKASNVLLDSKFQARVSDFGFARLIPDGATHVTTRVKGTLGYLAPEYAMLGKASESCDVYSFGILLLELASGKKAIEKLNLTVKQRIVDWALPLARQKRFKEMADPNLKGNFVESDLRRMVLVGLICAQSKPENRPTILDVIDLLKGEPKGKLFDLENNELFRVNFGHILSSSQHSADDIEEDSQINRIKELGPLNETVTGGNNKC